MAKTVALNTSMTNMTPTHDEIAAQAYQIYLREGCVEGRDLDHWLQAEAELRSLTNGNGNGHAVTAGRENAERATNRSSKPNTPSILSNSVVPSGAPIAQVTRTTTPRRNAGKREAAAVK